MLDEPEAHPLFPPKEDGDDPPEVKTISLGRLEAGGVVQAPRSFGAEELTSLEQIAELFGGGKYELVARGSRGTVTRRVAVHLAGRPKPLVPDDPKPDPSPAMGQMAGAAAQFAGMPSWLPMMIPLVIEYLKGQAEDRRLAAKTQHDMMMLQMQNGQNGSREYVQAMQGLNDRFMQQMATLMNRPAGAGGAADFKSGLEWASDLFAGKLEALQEQGGGDDDMMKTLQTLIQGVEAFKGMQGGGDAPAPTVNHFQPPGMPTPEGQGE